MEWPALYVLVAGWLIGILTPILTNRFVVWFRGPKLSLKLDNAVAPAWFGDGSRELFYARISVTNLKHRIAKDCRAYLTGIDEWHETEKKFKATDYRDSLPLIWSFDLPTPTADLPNGVYRHVDVVMYEPEKPGFALQLYSSSHKHFVPTQYAHLLNRFGTFRFTVLVAADEISPEQIRFKVAWDGSWPPKAEIA